MGAGSERAMQFQFVVMLFPIAAQRVAHGVPDRAKLPGELTDLNGHTELPRLDGQHLAGYSTALVKSH